MSKELSPSAGWAQGGRGCQPGERPLSPAAQSGRAADRRPLQTPWEQAWAGPRTQAALLGFQNQLQAALQEEGALGHPEWKSATRRQHVAEVGASRPAQLGHSQGQESLPIEPQFPGLQKGLLPQHWGHCQGKQPCEAWVMGSAALSTKVFNLPRPVSSSRK